MEVKEKGKRKRRRRKKRNQWLSRVKPGRKSEQRYREGVGRIKTTPCIC